MIDHQIWEPQVEALKENYEVITYDIRAHGKTTDSNPEDYSIELFADDLHKLVEQLEMEDPVICGLSLGGMVVQKYAEKYPADAEHVVIADSMMLQPHPFKHRLQSVYLWKTAGLLIKTIGIQRTVGTMSWLEEKVHGEDVGNDDEYLKNISGGILDEMTTDQAVNLIRAISDRDHVNFEDIDTDVTIIYGENESSLVMEQAREMHSQITDSEIIEVSDAGHVSNYDNPEEFTDTLRKIVRCSECA